METAIKLKIFIVNDDLFSSNLYEQHLRNLGHSNIRKYNHAEDCIAELHQNPDIIFFDYDTNPEQEWETIKKIKFLSPDVYLIILSAQKFTDLGVAALNNGAFDYITKDENDLEKISKVIHKVKIVIGLLRKKKPRRWHNLKSLFQL